MQRRGFFKYLGLGTAAAAGGVMGTAAILSSKENSDIIRKIEKTNNPHLQLSANYNPLPPPPAIPPGPNGYIIASNFPGKDAISVSMIAGPDGELYLKTNGKWRKVATE